MITIVTEKIKSVSQKNYDALLENLNLNKLTCSCGNLGDFIKHGYYNRSIKSSDKPVVIRILRVICKRCGKTHAIFPESIVPYSQICLNDHLSIIKAYTNNESFEPIMVENELIDENNIKYIITQYLRHWKERIVSFGISLYENISILCLKTFKRQFMQIKYVQNILSS